MSYIAQETAPQRQAQGYQVRYFVNGRKTRRTFTGSRALTRALKFNSNLRFGSNGTVSPWYKKR